MWIAIAHHLPERTRLHCPTVRRDEAACERLADALAAIPGVREVKVRPYTATAVIIHAATVTIGTLLEEAKRVTGCDRVLAEGEPPPVDPTVPPLSSLAKSAAKVVREIDRDVRRRSAGALDLGTLATLGFFGAGAAEVLATKKLPMPPWFNLAWWGFRTFVTVEQDEIRAAADDAPRSA